MAGFEVPVHDDAVLAALGRIESLLEQALTANQIRGAEMADTLDDVRGNLQDLGVDVDRALTEIVSTRQQLTDALANAGVDEGARAEIMGLIDAQQQKIVDLLNPAVPVEPNPEPVDPNDLPHPDNTLPGDLPPQ